MKPDMEMAYDEAGKGAPPLVLVHGLLSNRGHWRPQFDHFRAMHRVVSPDLRGHGATPPGTAELSIETLGADVAALLARLDITGAVIAGHSLGCRVVLEARRRAPGRIAGVVLVDGSNLGANGIAPAQRSLDQAIAATGYARFARKLYEDNFLEGHDPNLSGPIIAGAMAVPEQVCRSLFHSMIAYDAEQLVPALRGCGVPVLALQSTVFGPDRVRRPLGQGDASPYLDFVRANCPHAETEIIAGVGHFTQLEAPDEVNARIDAFLATLGG